MPELEVLNRLPPEEAAKELLKCCGSPRWVEKMVLFRPFPDENSLLATADKMWQSLTSVDWLEAFRAHPRIGEATTSKWTADEQAGVRGANEEVMYRLRKLNTEYEKKFGYLFLVCATGKTAEEMIELLKARMTNESNVELSVAMREQAKITKLRLKKWLQT